MSTTQKPQSTLPAVTTSTTALYGIVADPPPSSSSSSNLDGEDTEKSSSWIQSVNGGFFPNIPQQIRLLRQRRQEQRGDQEKATHALYNRQRALDHTDIDESQPLKSQQQPAEMEQLQQPTKMSLSSSSFLSSHRATKQRQNRTPIQITDIVQYKKEVVEVEDQLVAVRFYARKYKYLVFLTRCYVIFMSLTLTPITTNTTAWCKACKAVERPFRQLAKEFPTVKFVEVPVTKDNAYLHKGLGIPSLPFGHIYHNGGKLVEEMKINKNVFGDFKDILKTYVDGECPMVYDAEGVTEYPAGSDEEAFTAMKEQDTEEGAWN
jgi:thiol-disulfide isomerase/thioredoxin